MKLWQVERISIVSAIVIILCLVLANSDLGPNVTMIVGGIAIVFLTLLVLVNLRYNRCPRCGAYLWHTGKVCRSCGERLQKYR